MSCLLDLAAALALHLWHGLVQGRLPTLLSACAHAAVNNNNNNNNNAAPGTVIINNNNNNNYGGNCGGGARPPIMPPAVSCQESCSALSPIYLVISVHRLL